MAKKASKAQRTKKSVAAAFSTSKLPAVKAKSSGATSNESTVGKEGKGVGLEELAGDEDDGHHRTLNSLERAFKELKSENKKLKAELRQKDRVPSAVVATQAEIDKLCGQYHEEMEKIHKCLSNSIHLPPDEPYYIGLDDSDRHFSEYKKALKSVREKFSVTDDTSSIIPECLTIKGRKIRGLAQNILLENAHVKRECHFYNEMYHLLTAKMERMSADLAKIERVAMNTEDQLASERECMKSLLRTIYDSDKMRPDIQLKGDDNSVELAIERQCRQNLMKRIEVLEKALIATEPLFKIGVAIRLRYLEQAKLEVLGHTRDTIDKDIIEKGNAAAHGGNAVADSALFSRRQLAESTAGIGHLVERQALSVVDGNEIYKELYGCSAFSSRRNMDPT